MENVLKSRDVYTINALASMPGRWLDGGLSEGYEHDKAGVCLGDDQMKAYLNDMDMAGLASAWAMAIRTPT